jgi:hypothetical protein
MKVYMLLENGAIEGIFAKDILSCPKECQDQKVLAVANSLSAIQETKKIRMDEKDHTV